MLMANIGESKEREDLVGLKLLVSGYTRNRPTAALRSQPMHCTTRTWPVEVTVHDEREGNLGHSQILIYINLNHSTAFHLLVGVSKTGTLTLK